MDLMKFNNVLQKSIQLCLFPFSLQGKAKQWFDNQPNNTFQSWDDLAKDLLEEFFPPYKTNEIRGMISNLEKINREPFYEAWERVQALLYSCLHHSFNEWQLAETLLGGSPMRIYQDHQPSGDRRFEITTPWALPSNILRDGHEDKEVVAATRS